MYHVSAQGVDERMINVHYYYYLLLGMAEYHTFKVLIAEMFLFVCHDLFVQRSEFNSG